MSAPTIEDPLLIQEVLRGEVRLDGVDGGVVASFSERAPGKRRANEDAAAVIPLGGGRVLLVVADGLGGQPGADQASGIAVRTLAEALGPVRARGGDPRELFVAALADANDDVDELGLGAGTTIAAALVAGDHVRAFHVGDSMVTVVDAHGGVKFETVPHSPIGYALAAGMMTEEEALRHPERHIISNMVGSPQMRLETGPSLTFERGDTLVLASDGITDNLYRAELTEIVRQRSLDVAARELVDLCRSRMTGAQRELPTKPDDATFLLYRRES